MFLLSWLRALRFIGRVLDTSVVPLSFCFGLYGWVGRVVRFRVGDSSLGVVSSEGSVAQLRPWSGDS